MNKTLFDITPRTYEPMAMNTNPRRLARRSGPITSKLAAYETAANGQLGELERWAVDCVAQTPGQTQRELGAIHCPDDLRRIGRRLAAGVEAGTLHEGNPRQCSITGRMAKVYYPTKGK